MRLTRKTLGAAGCVFAPFTDRLPVGDFTVNLFGDTAINATAQVDGVDFSNQDSPQKVTVSRSGTTVTVTFPAGNPHYLGATTDYITINGANANASGTSAGGGIYAAVTGLDGTYQIASVTNATVVTYTSGTSATTVSTPCQALPLKFIAAAVSTASVSKTTVAVKAGATALYAGVVLNCTSYTAGVIVMDLIQPGKEM